MKKNNFKKELKNQSAILKQLEKSNADASVIEEQQKVVDAAKQAMEESKNTELEKEMETSKSTELEKAKHANPTTKELSFEVVNEETHEIETVTKKMGFIKHNRPIESKHVGYFVHIIANSKYDSVFPIIVADAEFVIERGYSVIDMNGEEIKEEDAKDYYAIIDGQHRGKAFAKLATTNFEKPIPNVHIRNIENIAEYLVDINEACKSWSNKDKFAVAGITAKDNEVFTAISTCISEGYNPSTSAIIYTGKKISSSILKKVLKCEEYELPKGAKFDKERGDKFITICTKAGMSVELITKRYYIEGFDSFAASRTEEEAFNALGKLSDIEAIKKVREPKEFAALLKEAA